MGKYLTELDEEKIEFQIDIEKDIKKSVNSYVDSLLDKTIIITTEMYHQALETEHGTDAVMLYLHYYFTAKLQKTNQVWATDKYCMKGLKWGNTRFKRAKKILVKDFGWIENWEGSKYKDGKLVQRDEGLIKRDDRGKIEKRFVRLKYIWTNKKTKELSKRIKELDSTGTETHQVDNTTCGQQKTNALNSKDKMLEVVNENVNVSILSLFEYLKIPSKDRKIWMKRYKDNRGYLLKTLEYAKKNEDDIENIVRWTQSALDNDYASSSGEELDEKERAWQEQKESESIEAEAFSKELNIGSITPETDGLSEKKIEFFRKLEISYIDDVAISAKLRMLIEKIKAGISDKDQEPYKDEIMQLINEKHLVNS